MAVYFVTGKLGSGKTLAMVGRIRDYLVQGRRVATNLDLNLDELLAPWRDHTDVIRIPDRPIAEDLDFLGFGYGTSEDDYDESMFGALVIDECALSLNTRTWAADKGRQSLINWVVHSRKKHWDVFFIVQDIDAIDKQIRDMFCEHLVVCERLDRMSLNITKAFPFVLFFAFGLSMAIGWQAGLGFIVACFCIMVPFGSRVPLPRIHRAKVYYGDSTSAPNVDTWTYVAKDLYPAYNTGQKYFDRDVPFAKGLSSMLSPWHLKGRYNDAKRPTADKFRPAFSMAFNAFFLVLGFTVMIWSFKSSSGFGFSFMDKKADPLQQVETNEPDLSPDLPTETVDNFDVRIAGSMAFGDGTFQYFFARADQPVPVDESSKWIVRPYGPCAAQIQIESSFHEVKCDYAPAGLGDSTGGSKGEAQPLRTAGDGTDQNVAANLLTSLPVLP